MSISTKQLAALGWEHMNPGIWPPNYAHVTGWHLCHCGHQTANFSYLLYTPDGAPVTAPSGRGFQNVQMAVEWLDEHLNPELIPDADNGRQEANAQAAREEMERVLRTPIANVSSAAGEMERDSPLFYGTGSNPTLF